MTESSLIALTMIIDDPHLIPAVTLLIPKSFTEVTVHAAVDLAYFELPVGDLPREI
jgi:hypothetical protein